MLKLQKIIFCFILLISWILLTIIVINENSLIFKQNESRINNYKSNFSLKKLNQAVSIEWTSDSHFYYIKQHQFQRLFLEEWVKTMPNLKMNKITFSYRNNNYSLPIEVIVKYFNSITNELINFWIYKIRDKNSIENL